MGKRIIQQRRGRGTMRYRSPGFNFKGEVKYPSLKDAMLKGVIIDLIHCPGHYSPLAKIKYENGENGLIIAAEGLCVGKQIEIGSKNTTIGNIMKLKDIPEGTEIYNIEKRPNDGGIFVRASGGSAKVVLKNEKGEVIIKMPSKKTVTFNPECRATIGIAAGGGRTEKPFVKAGKKHFAMKAKGKLWPVTSAVSMNAVDHPFGCGRGSHMGKPSTAPKNAPPGRKVGQIRARRTGKKK